MTDVPPTLHPPPHMANPDARVLVFTGGELLLAGDAVADVGRALRLAARVAARDGIRPSARIRTLLAAVDAITAHHGHSATGTPELPPDADLPSSATEDLIGTREAADLMARTDRDVRALCARGTLGTARRTNGRWLMQRTEILELIERRADR